MKQSFFVLGLLFIALPASAGSLLYGPESFSVNRNTPYRTLVEAQQYQSLQLSFSYDSKELDAPTSVQDDTFTYGILLDGVEYVLGTIKGQTGTTDAETGSLTVAVPLVANESSFEVFARLAANTDNDVVRITNLELTGEQVWDGQLNTPETAYGKSQGLVTICHFDNGAETFYKESVNISSIIKGRGHGQHGDDIIPLFWYIGSKVGDIALYGGNDWNKTNKLLFLNGCKEGG